jgi:hypothetical protein
MLGCQGPGCGRGCSDPQDAPRDTRYVAVSPIIEALLIGRLATPPTFTCDASRYACRSASSAPIGAYFRFALLGQANRVFLVGVLLFDPGARSAFVNGRIDELERVIDHEIEALE